MKLLLFKILFLIIFSTSILSQSVQFKLSKNNVAKGEPIIATFEIEGESGEVEVASNVFKENGVTAEYVGTEQSVQVVNLNVSKKKIVKFRIFSNKEGTYKVPKITILIDGKNFQSNDTSFIVRNEKYIPNNNRQHPFDSFFDKFGLGEEFGFQRPEHHYYEPEEDDIVIAFDVSRDRVFIGEPIVGYYMIYYKNMEIPNLERNANYPIELSFFANEILGGFSVSSYNKAQYKGKTYNVFPYNKEIFALIPLKKGRFKIGHGKFEIEGNINSFFSQRTMDTVPKSITVEEFPEPKPEEFTGEVGDYEIDLKLSKQNTEQNISISMDVVLKGEGSCSLFKDPLSRFCKGSLCDVSITFINQTKNRKFQQLRNGSFGFFCETIFHYSISSNKIGKHDLGNVGVSYFNPDKNEYEKLEKSIPTITITQNTTAQNQTPIVGNKKDNYIQYVKSALIILGIIFFGYLFRGQVKKLVGDIVNKLQNIDSKSNPKEIISLDKYIGSKKGVLLKNFLIQKGFNKEIVIELVKIKEKSNHLSFMQIYSKLDKIQKERLLNLVKELNLEIWK